MAEKKKGLVDPFAAFSKTTRTFITIVLFLLGVVVIYTAYVSTFVGFVLQWVFAIFGLAVIGMYIQWVNKLPGGYGMYLFGTKHGINFINEISKKNQKFWHAMSLWGLVVGLGLLSYPLIKGKISKKLFGFGLLSLVVLYVFVLTYLPVGFQFIDLQQIQTAIQTAQATPPSPFASVITGVLSVLLFITGFTGYFIALILYNAGLILSRLFAFTSTVVAGSPQVSTLTGALPGVAPLIPGITVPLIAGLVSIAILLIIHETAHGILSRIFNVRLKSVGLVLFGMIPVGAFVEPDEKQVEKLEPLKQTKIMAAGVSTNFIATVVFLVLMVAMLIYVVPSLTSNNVLVASTAPNTPAYGILQPGMHILYWNGYRIENLSSFTVAAAQDKPGSIVSIITNSGSYSFNAISIDNSTKGYVGVTVSEPLKTDPVSSFEYLIYSILALSFILNFAVAVVNLFPVPGFDGWRVYKTNMKNGKTVKYLAIIVCIALLINILPLFFPT